MTALTELRTPEFQAERLKTLHTPSAIEELPEGWHWCGLDNVTEGVFDCPHSTPKHVDEGKFYSVRTQDILGGKFDLKNCARVSEETYRSRISRAEPKFGDLVYSREGTYFGIAAEVPQNAFVCLGQRMVLIRPKQNLVYHSFLRWWLNSPVIANHIRGFYDGSVAERLNLPVIRTLPVAMPPLPEQKAIAAVLGCLDDKIELLREQNETLEALAQILFKRWFIDFNFPDENGNPYKDSGGKMVASELGEIPKGWKADVLNDYISISGGGTPSTKEPTYWNGEIAWSSPKDLSDRPDAFLFETNKTITSSGLGSISSGLNQAGSLLLSSRAPIGYVAFADIPVAVNQGYIVFAPDQYLSNQFMFLWLKKYMSVVNNAANGSTFLEISKKAFKEIVTIIPNEGVLHDFQNLILPQFEKLRSNLIQIRTLTLLRETLLPKLMKGELRIRT